MAKVNSTTRMTPFRCPNELYDAVKETMNRVQPEVRGKPATLTDVIIVALSEWVISKMHVGQPVPPEPDPKNNGKKKNRKKKQENP